MASQQQQQPSSYAKSTYSESTTFSYSKPSESQPKNESKPKRSLRQRLKKSLKEIGYPPTYHHDVLNGKNRPEYGIYGDSVFTDKRTFVLAEKVMSTIKGWIMSIGRSTPKTCIAH
ncbi:hypothetical protein CONLIGDRAFT_710735 [Coniochaeta ligniaria NRRL 30616]|uniref:Uncharacterized protein n=1 Tax=Coniochaeta ligniaria NRRL 30616 TaxID=1408157 RepID=A0A1J7J609_9PEZI|nr:hypothetical protein CONLIGDRAFT_710735 [Coniochaeta ligniaria NRRL 30616]